LSRKTTAGTTAPPQPLATVPLLVRTWGRAPRFQPSATLVDAGRGRGFRLRDRRTSDSLFARKEGLAMPDEQRMAALDPSTIPERSGSGYPEPFRTAVAGRAKRALGDAFGLTQFGVNLVRLPPGCWSSQRHWHSHEDEFVYVVEGELTLVTDAGEQLMRPGMVAGFKAGQADGHHLINRSERPASYLEIGTRIAEDEAVYSDIDMELRRRPEGHVFVHKNGESY
jgi:uncharacterized cupin superfamily protein